ncbi:MAG: S9 family peptidase [Novosphingobium sp.]|nr:S9 family peptidase [Novosphingobium sp.]
MRTLARWLAAAALVSLAAPSLSAPVKLAYPQTRRDDVVETRFGERIADPFRWLENDVRHDRDVATWVARENELTRSYLDALPQRAWFADRMRELLDFERFGLPKKAGGRYFYIRNSGLQNQSQLFVRHGLDGAPRLLLDPNGWARDGATALDDWEPARDGRHLLYSVQDAGSDWRTLRALDVDSGESLPDAIHWAKFTDLGWVGNDGFLYSRFPEPRAGREFQATNHDQAIYYHRLGTAQDQDQLVFATPDRPELYHQARVTSDGRYAVITSSYGTDERYEIHLIDLKQRNRRGWAAPALVTGFDSDWRLIDSVGSRLWFVTNKNAPRYRVVAFDARRPQSGWREVVPERDETLERGRVIGDKLVLSYLKDAASRALVFDLHGKPTRILSLNGIGTAMGFSGRPGDPETFYEFTSFAQPAAVFRLNIDTSETRPFALPALPFRPENFVVEQRFYRSKDGTRIPLFLVRRKDVAAAGRPVPTLLYGYGGFNISLTPGYAASRMAWLEAGGAFAMANLRGGGEYGQDWHNAGRLANKQNVFDDFIAAGEYLIGAGVAPKGGLAAQGGSNGGLLVGAAVNQRPDLFAAANPQVGVMDMLRFDRFTEGRTWTDDYGKPGDAADFRVLRAYSPYHNIHGGADYPAILVTTADTDDRVVPGHSFKYTAALQAAAIGDKPHLIRIESRAGHGAGKPTDKAIAENADILAFLAEWTGLRPG